MRLGALSNSPETRGTDQEAPKATKQGIGAEKATGILGGKFTTNCILLVIFLCKSFNREKIRLSVNIVQLYRKPA